MTDYFRTRIAAVLREHQPAWGHATLDRTSVWEARKPPAHRYVTHWEDSDE